MVMKYCLTEWSSVPGRIYVFLIFNSMDTFCELLLVVEALWDNNNENVEPVCGPRQVYKRISYEIQKEHLGPLLRKNTPSDKREGHLRSSLESDERFHMKANEHTRLNEPPKTQFDW